MWTNCNNGKITMNFNEICTSWKKSNFSFVLSLVGPSMVIFINKVLYSIITCQIGNNINIQQVLTFFKILTPFVSISFTSFVNSKCLLRLLEIIVQGLKQMINSIHHLQIWQNLNCKISYVNHTTNLHGIWSPTIEKSINLHLT